MAQTTCGHEGCTCEAAEGEYCSDYCARQGNDAARTAADSSLGGHECHCGHAHCDAVAATSE